MPEPSPRAAPADASDTSRPREAPARGFTIAFHGAKGGVGTTALVAEAAALLARSQRTVAIDADLDRGALHYRLDIPVRGSTPCTEDVLRVCEDLPGELFSETVTNCPCGAALLPAKGRTEDAPRPREEAAAFLLDSASRDYQRVLVDTGSNVDAFTVGLLAGADVAVLVLSPELACLGPARRLVRPGWRPGGLVAVVNRSLGRRDTFSREDVESFLGVRPLAWIPEDTVRCRSLSDSCRPLSAGRTPLASAIRFLVGRLDRELAREKTEQLRRRRA